ncbi:MAG: hypothetical protein KAR00_00520 [Candidatus Pacebacteria bacterium]|nr:hypothetical protein [Candidatus Paceibacterota bacterium]
MKLDYPIKFLAVFGLLFVCFGLSVFHVDASVGLTIEPVKVSHTINPGDSVSGKIQVINRSDEPVKVEVNIKDFVPLKGTVTIQIIERAEGVTTVKDWVTLDPGYTFILPENGSKQVTYTINAPNNAEPGGHFGVALFKANKIVEEGQLKIGTELGMLIFVTIPGSHLQKGDLLGFSSEKFVQKGPVNFNVDFENTGTVHFEPKGTIRITNIFGKEVANIPISGQIVLPGGVRTLFASWQTASLLLGRYKAEINIKDGEGNVLTATAVTFYAFPLWYLVSFILCVVVLFFVLKFLKKKLNISISINK